MPALGLHGSGVHSVHPASTPTCWAGVEETVASWDRAGASFFGHVQPQGTFSTLPPGAGALECTQFPELAQQSPQKKVQLALSPSTGTQRPPSQAFIVQRLHRLLPSVPRVPPRFLVALCPGVFPSLITGPELPATIYLAGRERSEDFKNAHGGKQERETRWNSKIPAGSFTFCFF